MYGYRKDPQNKHHWLIDEEAAAVVRRIFRLTIEGNGPYEIARILFDDHVETPAVSSVNHSFQAGVYGAYGKLPFP
nr:recombinase family protein [Enterocloster clostridioformis]